MPMPLRGAAPAAGGVSARPSLFAFACHACPARRRLPPDALRRCRHFTRYQCRHYGCSFQQAQRLKKDAMPDADAKRRATPAALTFDDKERWRQPPCHAP